MQASLFGLPAAPVSRPSYGGGRTDPHRPGAIRPRDYTFVLHYSLASTLDGWPVPAVGVNCEIERRKDHHDENGAFHAINGSHAADGRCCVLGLRSRPDLWRFASHGGTGKCTVCGTCYTHGEIWQHDPTGELIHVGHVCAAKYELFADYSDHELALMRVRNAVGAQIQRAVNAKRRDDERAELEAAHPGISADLETDHPIIRDIAARLSYGLSDKQVALVRKLAAEVRNPRPEEPKVAAPRPAGRITVEGVIVSTKVHDSDFYGTSYKMTVKVTTEAGAWMAWGTVPEALFDQLTDCGPDGKLALLRGRKVRFDCALKPGREPHFALISRPTKARLVE